MQSVCAHPPYYHYYYYLINGVKCRMIKCLSNYNKNNNSFSFVLLSLIEKERERKKLGKGNAYRQHKKLCVCCYLCSTTNIVEPLSIVVLIDKNKTTQSLDNN